MRLQQLSFTLSVFFAASTSAACSDDGTAAGAAGGGGAAQSGSSSPSAAGSRSAAGAGSNAEAGAGASGASAAGSGGAAGAAVGGSGMFTKMGVCGQRGRSTVNATTFMGFEEFYIIADRGFGDDICVIKFDVKRVGDAPAGCDDPTADVDCLWTHQVEYSNPSLVTDMAGVCANSQRALTAAAIAEIEGSRASYGFVSEFAGHNSVLMKYDESKTKWDAFGNATWDEDASALRFDRRDGVCNY